MIDRRRLILAAAATGLVAGCGERAAAPAPTRPQAIAPDPARSATGPVVTLVGDSITAGLGLPATEALPAQLQAALARAGVAARVRGAGVSGDTSAGGLARLDFSVQADTAVCVLALGGNDLLQGVEPARVRTNIDAAVARLQARGMAVVLAGVIPTAAASGSYGREFAAAFAQVARARRVAAFLPNLMEGVGGDLRQADGLHPNAEGVRVIVGRLTPLVVEALAARAR